VLNSASKDALWNCQSRRAMHLRPRQPSCVVHITVFWCVALSVFDAGTFGTCLLSCDVQYMTLLQTRISWETFLRSRSCDAANQSFPCGLSFSTRCCSIPVKFSKFCSGASWARSACTPKYAGCGGGAGWRILGKSHLTDVFLAKSDRYSFTWHELFYYHVLTFKRVINFARKKLF